jgi:ubiquinone/menaquinone biosynthesis C-methylase UbiE
MDLKEYRKSDIEQLRINSLMDLVPSGLKKALDLGARDGYLSKKLTGYFDKVVAVDLQKPDIIDDKIESRQGDIAQLDFADNSFDLVLCAEVLEHIPTQLFEKACQELTRVANKYLLIGVPYNQDIRFGRTTCFSCGGKNPPWGHVNKFNEKVLEKLFPTMKVEKVEYVGQSTSVTNFISVFLFDLADNPYGTYSQDEACIHCGKKLLIPPERTFQQKIFSKIAVYLNRIQALFVKSRPNWIHVLLVKP